MSAFEQSPTFELDNEDKKGKKLTLLTMSEQDAAFLTSVLSFIDDPRTVVAVLTVLRTAKPRFIPTKSLLSNVICSASEDRRKMFGSDYAPELSINTREAETMTYSQEGSSLEIGCTFLRKLYDIVRDAIPIEHTPSMIHRPSINEHACVSFLHNHNDRCTQVVYEEDGLKVSLSLTSNKCKVASCQKVVMWSCCQRNMDHVCSECMSHAARCNECGGLVCHENCFWGHDMGVNLCTICGQLCAQCDRIVPADDIFKCSNYPCGIEEVCLDCANGETQMCAECGKEYCEECVEEQGVKCYGCPKFFCDDCNNPTMCEECSKDFCLQCVDYELNSHPKYLDDPDVYICNNCLVNYEEVESESDP